MPRPLINKAFAVGLLVAVAGTAFLVAYTFFQKGGLSSRDSYVVHAYFEDATGLTWKSRVQIAGIQVGEVDRIDLEGGRARLTLRIRNDIEIKSGACVTTRFPSALLPDAILDLAPGAAAEPSLRGMPAEDREIKCVIEATTVAKLIESMNGIAADVKNVTRELSSMVAGSQGSIKQIIANLERTTATIDRTVDANAGRLDAIMRNAEALSGTLAADREHYHVIAVNIASASERLDEILRGIQSATGGEGGKGGIEKTLVDARQSIERLNRSMEQIEKVTTNIAEGRGVAGKLLMDERLGDKVGTTVEGLADHFDRVNKMVVKVELRSEWLLNHGESKSYASFSLWPRPDRYYLIQVVSDPRGVDTQTVARSETQTASGVTQTTTTTTLNELRTVFSLEFAKRFGPATFRVGLIESSGGFGADLHLFKDSLTISADLFQFSRPHRPKFARAKLWANYHFWKYFYASAGMDDFLNSWNAGHWPGGPKFAIGNDVFFGVGLVFTDDDLKTLLGAGGGAVAGGAASAK